MVKKQKNQYGIKVDDKFCLTRPYVINGITKNFSKSL